MAEEGNLKKAHKGRERKKVLESKKASGSSGPAGLTFLGVDFLGLNGFVNLCLISEKKGEFSRSGLASESSFSCLDYLGTR